MTTAATDIDFKINVDASAGNRAIREVEESAQKAARPGGGVHALGEQLDHVGGKAGKDAANALRTASFAMGSLGGEAATVVGVMGDFADLLTGGPVTIGLTILGAGLAAAWHEYEKVEKQTDAARESMQKFVADIEREHLATIDKLKTGVKDLAQALLDFDKDTSQIQLDKLVEQRSNMDGDIAGLEQRLAKAKSDANIERSKIRPDTDYLQSLDNAVSIGSAKLAALRQESEVTDRAINSTTKLVLTLDARADEKERKEAAKAAAQAAYKSATEAILAGPEVQGDNAFGLGITDPEAFAREQAAAHEKAVQATGAIDDKLRNDQLAREQAYESARLAAHRQALDEHLQMEAAYFDKVDGYYKAFASDTIGGFATSAIGTIQTYANESAQHHKDAAQVAAAAFEQSVGANLVSLGQRALFEGAEVLLTSHGLDPAGYGLLGLGAAAIAAGTGMGAIGSAGAANIQASRSAAEKKTADAGANHGRVGGSGGSSQGGGVTIVNNFGVGGPSPDDSARRMTELLRLANRRRFT